MLKAPYIINHSRSHISKINYQRLLVRPKKNIASLQNACSDSQINYLMAATNR
jgi:hypothetical protein